MLTPDGRRGGSLRGGGGRWGRGAVAGGSSNGVRRSRPEPAGAATAGLHRFPYQRLISLLCALPASGRGGAEALKRLAFKSKEDDACGRASSITTATTTAATLDAHRMITNTSLRRPGGCPQRRQRRPRPFQIWGGDKTLNNSARFEAGLVSRIQAWCASECRPAGIVSPLRECAP